MLGFGRFFFLPCSSNADVAGAAGGWEGELTAADAEAEAVFECHDLMSTLVRVDLKAAASRARLDMVVPEQPTNSQTHSLLLRFIRRLRNRSLLALIHQAESHQPVPCRLYAS